ncbi:adenosylcobinamide-GDP ribazoletransferase [Undibacterium arcticum]|uniref:Adenosylcobinamide-GDP ribazoletransferase n=1 Tax=Undibacterium arcticum TaxID=1762892 RepID=A0ABV7F847_9BURK
MNPAPVGLITSGLHQLRLFFIALQFFTRLPIPRWVGFDAGWLQHAARYFPAVGLVVGTITAAVYTLALQFWPPAVAVLLSTIASIYLTGAFHEDGFADVCDGFGGGMTPARVLEIMQDSRVGAYGAIGIALLLGLKCVTLTAIPSTRVAALLLAAHPLSRLLAVGLVWRLDYVKADGKAKPLAQHMTGVEFSIALFSAVVVMAALMLCGAIDWRMLASGSALAVLAALWLARVFVRCIGGYTGDCLGAVQQFSELAFYLGALAAIGHLTR